MDDHEPGLLSESDDQAEENDAAERPQPLPRRNAAGAGEQRGLTRDVGESGLDGPQAWLPADDPYRRWTPRLRRTRRIRSARPSRVLRTTGADPADAFSARSMKAASRAYCGKSRFV